MHDGHLPVKKQVLCQTGTLPAEHAFSPTFSGAGAIFGNFLPGERHLCPALSRLSRKASDLIKLTILSLLTDVSRSLWQKA